MNFLLKTLAATTLAASANAALAVDPFIEELYDISCKACHSTGAGGAPKPFDKAEWEPRLAKGKDVLLKNAIDGYKGMPPLGMCGDCTKEDLQDLIDYMSTSK